MATAAKKSKKSCKVLDSWFTDPELKGIFQRSHPKNSETSLYCLVCEKSVTIEHQGKLDLTRHCRGKSHTTSVNSKRVQGPITAHFNPQGSTIEQQISIAEVKVAGFLAEHNLPFATADHLGPLFKSIFPDSKIAKGYSCGKTKASCILNRAIVPDLRNNLVEQMRNSCFSIATDGSNDQGLTKMNPVTVRLFDINQHKVVTKFYDMCASSSSTAVGIFNAINNSMEKNMVSWDKCVSLGVDNTSVNVGKHNSVIVEARKKNKDIILMGCPCHIAHNTASKATKSFVNVVKEFDVEQLLVDVYFHFDYSSKRKNLLVQYCDFCDQQYSKIIKFHSVRWLGLSSCIERVLKLFPSLKSYFLSLPPDRQEDADTRNNRLIHAFQNPLLEIYLLFLSASIQPLITLNLLLQRTDPLIHILHDALFSCSSILLSRFAQPELVRQYQRGEISKVRIKESVKHSENILPNESLFVGFFVRSKVKSLLEEGDITEAQVAMFYRGCLEFHRTAFIYAIDNFPIDDEFLKHARFLNFYEQKCSFESVVYVTEKLKKYINFNTDQLNELEQEFLLLQSLNIDNMSPEAKNESSNSRWFRRK